MKDRQLGNSNKLRTQYHDRIGKSMELIVECTKLNGIPFDEGITSMIYIIMGYIGMLESEEFPDSYEQVLQLMKEIREVQLNER